MNKKLAIIELGVAAALTLGAGVAHATTASFKARNNWGVAFGSVHWDPNDITITGTLASLDKNSFVYLSWNALGLHYHKEVAAVDGAGDQASFNRHFSFPGGASDIKVTVCSQVDGKWRCGVPADM